jgi:hypothetical protein
MGRCALCVYHQADSFEAVGRHPSVPQHGPQLGTGIVTRSSPPKKSAGYLHFCTLNPLTSSTAFLWMLRMLQFDNLYRYLSPEANGKKAHLSLQEFIDAFRPQHPGSPSRNRALRGLRGHNVGVDDMLSGQGTQRGTELIRRVRANGSYDGYDNVG